MTSETHSVDPLWHRLKAFQTHDDCRKAGRKFMKIIITGGSGQVGSVLARAFHGDHQEVIVLSRQPMDMPWRTVVWDGQTVGAWAAEIDGADAVINLAGRSVNCRYTPQNRREIIESRICSTRAVGEAIQRANHPPHVWLQASTATIYAHRYDAPNDEATGFLGGVEPNAPDTWRFSIDVARQWECALDEAETPDTRKVAMRSAMVMSPDRGGVFDTLLGLVRHGLGGTEGDGRQYVSWVHDTDFVRAVQWLIERDDLTGPVNVASPDPLPNAEFLSELRQVWGIKIGLPAPAWLLEIAARIMGTETELVLKSRRVVPSRLVNSGFTFTHPGWPEAAGDLCRRWRAEQSTRG